MNVTACMLCMVYVYVCVQFTFGRDEVLCFVASHTISSPVVQPTSSSKSRGDAPAFVVVFVAAVVVVTGFLVVVVTGFLGVLVVVVTGLLGFFVVVVTGFLVVVVTGFLVVVVTGFLVVVFVFGVLFPVQTSPVFLVQTLPELSRHLSALGSSRHCVLPLTLLQTSSWSQVGRPALRPVWQSQYLTGLQVMSSGLLGAEAARPRQKTENTAKAETMLSVP